MNIGAWSIPVSWGFIAIHLVHYVPNELENIPGYSDGRILAWSYGVHHSSTDVYVIGMNDLENPSNFINLSPLSHNIFCSGHTHLPDGRIIIAGGHEDNDIGLKETIRFNVMNNSWMMLSLMGYDRWYPSLTTLADGRILVSGGTFGGIYENVRPICEVYNPESNTWTSVVAGNDGLHYYPFMFVLPRAVTMKVNGQPTLFPAGSVFCAGWKQGTRLLGYFSSTSSWVWSDSIDSGKDDDYSSAVMYEPGKILLAGGGKPGTNTARKIAFTSFGQQPQWQPAGNMTYGRRNLNLVLLADGKVLAVGGNYGDPVTENWNYANPVYVPELWNPDTNTWTPLAPMSVPRWYHSAAMLLPDGRVLATGGDYNAGTPNWSGGQNPLNGTKVEFFTPPLSHASAHWRETRNIEL